MAGYGRRLWIARLLAAGGLSLLAATTAVAETQAVTILHDNDLHGHLRAFCYTETGRRAAERCGVGGAARRATLIAALKRQARTPVLLVDAGDTTTRGPLTTQYEGMDEIAAMNALGYGLAALGNNEFKLKDGLDKTDAAGAQADLRRLIAASTFPWLCANVTDPEGRPLEGVKPFVVRRMGRLRVAFLGLTTLKSVRYAQTKGLHFQAPEAAALTWVPIARAQADVVIALTHLGVDQDRKLAKDTRGIDAIIGGDSHTFLYTPVEETNLDGRRVPIVQDGEFGANLGAFRLTFSRSAGQSWTLARDSDRLIPVSSHLRSDPRILRLVEGYAHPLDVVVGRLGRIGADPEERKRQTAEILSAAWRSAAQVDFGLQPEDTPYEVFRTRRVTRYQIHAILPFHEDLVIATLKGDALSALRDAPTRPFVGRLHLASAGSPIDPAQTYRVAMLNAVAETLGIAAAQDTGVEARDALEQILARPERSVEGTPADRIVPGRADFSTP